MVTGAVGNLHVRLTGDGLAYQKMLRKSSVMTKRFGKQITSLGKSLSLKLTLPLTILGGVAVVQFAKFDKAMTESTSIMKVTTEQIERMRKSALELSKTAPQAPAELARSYFFLASAGFDAERAIAALPLVTKFATAGAFDMALATDLLTDAQSALGLASKDAAINLTAMTRVADVLVKANTLANASVQQFSVALTSKAGAALKSFNKDVEEGVAVLAALADQGIKAELAGNALDRMIRLLSKASQDNQKAFERFNFRVFDSTGKMRNLGDIVGNLEDSLRGMSDQQKAATLTALGFEARVQGIILPLLGTSQAIKLYEKDLKQAGGTTEDVADKQMKSFSNQMKLLKNQITVVAIKVGQQLIPTVKMLAGFIKNLAERWSGLTAQTQKTVISVLLITAAIGPLLFIVGLLVQTLGFLAAAIRIVAIAMLFLAKNPIVAIITLLVGAVLLASGAFNTLTEAIGSAIDKVSNVGDMTQEIDELTEGLKKAQQQADKTFSTGLKRQLSEQTKQALELKKALQAQDDAEEKLRNKKEKQDKKISSRSTTRPFKLFTDAIQKINAETEKSFNRVSRSVGNVAFGSAEALARIERFSNLRRKQERENRVERQKRFKIGGVAAALTISRLLPFAIGGGGAGGTLGQQLPQPVSKTRRLTKPRRPDTNLRLVTKEISDAFKLIKDTAVNLRTAKKENFFGAEGEEEIRRIKEQLQSFSETIRKQIELEQLDPSAKQEFNKIIRENVPKETGLLIETKSEKILRENLAAILQLVQIERDRPEVIVSPLGLG